MSTGGRSVVLRYGAWRGTVGSAAGGAPGEIVALGDEGLSIACGSGRLVLTELQRAGGRRMLAAEFVRGRPPRLGARFEARPADAPPLASPGIG